MLPRQYRLSLTQRFDHPKVIHSPYFTLRTALSPTEFSRAGLIIAKKVDKRAVKRNRLRRVIMTALYPLLLSTKTPTDLLVILKPESATISEENLVRHLQESLTKERII